MEQREPLMEQIIRKQIEKWEKRTSRESDEDARVSVLTVSVEPGSGGTLIAKNVAERLGFDLLDKALIEVIAESTEKSARVVEALEKERRSGIEDFIASLIDGEYLYPGLYLRHLMKIVHAIAAYGKVVMVGRGANFILPADECFSIRVIAPEKIRFQNIMKRFEVEYEEAKRRVIQREAKRSAFVKQSFHKDVSDPDHYDLVVNTGETGVERAAQGICAYYTAVHGVECEDIPSG